MFVARWGILPDWMTVSLSLGERVRVRGKGPRKIPQRKVLQSALELGIPG
jgi:hypothetical protein